MTAAANKHPPREVLQAFGLGNLDDASVTQVSQHLETCVDCKRQVAELSSDSLLERLRKANGPADTPAPGKPMTPAKQSAAPAPNSVPAELQNSPQYEILRELGAGGMGVVYLAKNKLMDRLEVLKVINTAMMRRAGALDRFMQEIRAAAALSHDNVVKAHSALQFGELLVFAMEYVEGDDLAKMVKTHGALPIANACFYVRQVALGLQHAHEKNMVHRDIKPHNLILAREGKKHFVKILDFGLAKATSEKKVDGGLTGDGKMLGTPDYMAPEQIQDAASADIRADIYSLGCTLYYLLTASTPFTSTSLYGLLQAQQTQNARPLNVVRPEVPVELAAVVAKMMAKEPAKRYQKPLEVAQALTPFFKPGVKGPGAPPSLSVGESVKAAPTKAELVTKRTSTKAPEPPSLAVPMPPSPKPTNALAFEVERPVQKSAAKNAKAKSPQRFKLAILAGAVLAAAAMVLLGAVVVFFWQTPNGVVRIEIDDPQIEVVFDNHGATFKGVGTQEIKLTPGKHGLHVKRGDLDFHTDKLILKKGEETTLKIEWFEGKLLAFQDGKKIGEKIPIVTRPKSPEAGKGKTSPSIPETGTLSASLGAAPPPGAVVLFDGKSLPNWVSRRTGGPADWKVLDDGALEVGAGDIYTQQTFGPDYQLHVEFWVPLMENKSGQARGNSGVFLQGRFEVQILDSFGTPKPNVGDCGALYGLIAPSKNACERPEQWQSFDITFHAPRPGKAGRVTVVLNGTTIIDNGEFDRAFPGGLDKMTTGPGPILLQSHGAKVRFRNLWLLPDQPKKAQEQSGFVALFNGKDLTGWQAVLDGKEVAPGKTFVIKDGTIVVSGQPNGYLTTTKSYKDYVVKYDWRYPRPPNLRDDERFLGNSGLFVHIQGLPATGIWPTCVEVQGMNKEHGKLIPVGMTARAKFPFDLYALMGARRKVGEWNTTEVICQNGRITSKVNGTQVATGITELTEGAIGLQSEGSEIHIKNIGIKVGLLALSTTAQSGDKKNPAATPSPRLDEKGDPDKSWMKRHEDFVAIANKGEVGVLFLGDSITDGWRNFNPKNKAGGKNVWEKTFAPLRAANFGIGGDLTQHVLWRIQNGELDGIKPKVAVLMIGTNNTGSDSTEQIADGVTAIVTNLQHKSPHTKVLVLAVFPRGKEIPNNGNTKIIEINKLIAKLDDGKNVKYLDIGAKFMKDGRIPAEIMHDYLHLTEEGYQIWADAITPTLTGMLKGFDPFFNGKDLTGWEGLINQFWSVKDGAIVGATPPNGINFNTFLCSKKKYKNFELQFQVKLSKNGNSGVQIRSKIINPQTFAVGGPQCDMGSKYWGSLYGEAFNPQNGFGGGGGPMKGVDAKLISELVKVEDFNDYYIKCVGQHVTIKLNGKTTVDDDFPIMPAEGIIAWQIHGGPPMEVVFKNIRFKEID
jgi:serine/threonine protein kinase/lysophospholipase L1-like esterase